MEFDKELMDWIEDDDGDISEEGSDDGNDNMRMVLDLVLYIVCFYFFFVRYM